MLTAEINGQLTSVLCPVREIASCWRQHAQQDGISDRDVQLGASRAKTPCGCPGWYARFTVPRSGVSVVIEVAQPHGSAQAARAWLAWMLLQLHHNGNVTLWPREGEH